MSATFIETDCTITSPTGQKLTSGGAYIADERAVVYVENNSNGHLPPWGDVTDWHGSKVGTFERVSHWITPASYVRSYTYAITATINGRKYFGRTQGPGMVASLKAYKNQ